MSNGLGDLSRTDATRVRLAPGLVVTRSAVGLVIDGGPHRVSISEPPSAEGELERFEHWLRSLSSWQEIAGAEAPHSPEQAARKAALRLLRSHGLLEFAIESSGMPASLADTSRTQESAAYFSRLVADTGGFPSGQAVMKSLADARIAVMGEESVVAMIAMDLTDSGVGTVVRSMNQLLPSLDGGTSSRVELVALQDHAFPDETAQGVVDSCRTRGVPVLRFGKCQQRIEIGPWFHGPYAACYSCFRQSFTGDRHNSQPSPASAVQLPDLLAALVTQLLLQMLIGRIKPDMRQRATIYSSGDLPPAYDMLVPYPSCERCLGASAAPSADSALLYEWKIGYPAFSGGDDLEGSRMGRSTRELMSWREKYSARPRTKLPARDSLIEPRHWADVSPEERRDLMGALLNRAAGFRSQGRGFATARWTANGGNLASTEIYLCADQPSLALPGAICHYNDLEHSLEAIIKTPYAEIHDMAVFADLQSTGLLAVVVFVCNFGRIRRRYGEFAFRLGHLDAGCASMQFAIAASIAGFRTRFSPGWPDAVVSALDLDATRQAVTSVAGLYPGRD